MRKRLDITPKESNLTFTQWQTLSKLQNHPDLIIKAADKGGNIVLMTKSNYEAMCFNILSNPQWYRRISTSCTSSFKNEFLQIINNAFSEGLVDQDLYDYLDVRSPRVVTFYALLKVHKNPLSPPGRQIISGIRSLTENASKLVDSVLMPHVISLPSYKKDILDLLKQMEGMVVPPDAPACDFGCGGSLIQHPA